MWTHELFGVEKPIIALLHLDAMPGDPGFCGSLETVLAHARADLEALQAGGVDGILFANEFSRPYQAVPDIAMISAMAYLIGNLRPILDRPFGVNVVKNPIATIDLAAATGASFARNSFSGAYAGEYGLFSASSGEAARHRQALGIPGMKLLYKVNPESDAFLAPRDLRVVAKSILYGGFADGLCALLASIYEVARGSGVPVFCNTGCNHRNVHEKLKYCDAVCMGTAFKGPDGRVVTEKVRSFMETVGQIRAEL